MPYKTILGRSANAIPNCWDIKGRSSLTAKDSRKFDRRKMVHCSGRKCHLCSDSGSGPCSIFSTVNIVLLLIYVNCYADKSLHAANVELRNGNICERARKVLASHQEIPLKETLLTRSFARKPCFLTVLTKNESLEVFDDLLSIINDDIAIFRVQIKWTAPFKKYRSKSRNRG